MASMQLFLYCLVTCHLFCLFTEATNSSPHSTRESMMYSDINSRIGSCMPLSAMRIGTIIHNIELNPGQGGKLVRAAGTSAKILKEPTSAYCLIQLPSGVKKLIDSRCRATCLTVYKPSKQTIQPPCSYKRSGQGT